MKGKNWWYEILYEVLSTFLRVTNKKCCRKIMCGESRASTCLATSCKHPPHICSLQASLRTSTRAVFLFKAEYRASIFAPACTVGLHTSIHHAFLNIVLNIVHMPQTHILICASITIPFKESSRTSAFHSEIYLLNPNIPFILFILYLVIYLSSIVLNSNITINE